MSQVQRSFLFYLITIGLFGALIYGIMLKGDTLRQVEVEVLPPGVSVGGDVPAAQTFLHTLDGNMHHPLAILLMQILAIIATARLCAYLFNKLGQPSVIGEIVAGIVLGPSVVGYWFPGTFAFLFPEGSLTNLASMVGYSLGIISPDPADFGNLVVVSLLAIATSVVCSALHWRNARDRAQLLRLSKV